jgi:hypothetical protein
LEIVQKVSGRALAVLTYLCVVLGDHTFQRGLEARYLRLDLFYRVRTRLELFKQLGFLRFKLGYLALRIVAIIDS